MIWSVYLDQFLVSHRLFLKKTLAFLANYFLLIDVLPQHLVKRSNHPKLLAHWTLVIFFLPLNAFFAVQMAWAGGARNWIDYHIVANCTLKIVWNVLWASTLDNHPVHLVSASALKLSDLLRTLLLVECFLLLLFQSVIIF